MAMHLSTVHPQNYVVNAIAEDNGNGNTHLHQNKNCSPTKQCIWLFTPIIIVVIIMTCAIVLPLVITPNRNKDTSQLSSSSALNNGTTMITITEMTVVDNSTSDTQSIENASTSTSNVDNDTFKTTADSINTSTEINEINITNSTTESMSTSARLMIALNHANDTIIGLYNTTAGGSTGGSNGSYSALNEIPQNAMDDSLTTKYLNFGHKGGVGILINGPGIGTGFLVIPSIHNSTLACGLRFATANDNPQRDPITVTLEGSNVTTLAVLHYGSSWTLIYNGSTGINATSNPGFHVYGIQQNFSNTKRFSSYRLLITSQRADADAVQYSEARIVGYI